MTTNRFIAISGAVILLLTALAYWVLYMGWVSFNLRMLMLGFLVVWVFTSFAFFSLDKSLQKSPARLLNRMMGSMMIKMVVGLASIAVVAIFYKPFIIEYVTGFLIAYFILTGFEVVSLIGKLRAVSQEAGK